VGGRVEGLTLKQTRNGKRMALVTLEDLSGQAEVVVFPVAFERYKALLERDRVLIVQGRREGQEGGRGGGIIAEEIFDLTELERASELHLWLPAEAVERPLLEALKGVLEEHPGAARVTAHVFEEDRQEIVETGIGVKPSRRLLEALKARLPEAGHVELKLPKMGSSSTSRSSSNANASASAARRAQRRARSLQAA